EDDFLDFRHQRWVYRVSEEEIHHDARNQSTFRPTFLITGAQRSTSALSSAPNCSGVPPTRSKPCAFILCTTSGSLSTALISALSLSMIGCGVPAGTTMPFHASDTTVG